MFVLFLLCIIGCQTPPATLLSNDSVIAFVSDRSGHWHIYIMNTNKSGITQLTNNEGGSNHSPDWSPDGRKIAFVSHRNGAGGIFVINADSSSGVTRLTMGFDDNSPRWSPDGEQIAYISEGDIYLMNKDGHAQVNLTNSPRDDESYPVWFPDGTQIAFVSNGQIYIINVDGSNRRKLINGAGGFKNFAFSHDSMHIFFDGLHYYPEEIGLLDLSDFVYYNLTQNQTSNDSSPIWSTKEMKVAFVSERDGNREIYLMNADGTEQTRMTHNDADDFDPVWRP